ncbi:BPTI/Kunitz domain-containing protein 4-like [Physella acuta]|uniref:BPTI/Kunitz domain-containing protein 4-like n=1 Tax=Physella acuta TaxID=109671 RepID=UPI0027DD5F88|nr:BPTI/Kunitz domain-containing protein 4-like [Physella acuta]
MKFLLLSTVCVLAAFSSTFQPALSAICVELCSPSPLLQAAGYNPCPEGQECRSNGCGHTCQTVNVGKRFCGGVMCGLYCPYGFATGNGCTYCSCNPNPLLGILKVNGVSN